MTTSNRTTEMVHRPANGHNLPALSGKQELSRTLHDVNAEIAQILVEASQTSRDMLTHVAEVLKEAGGECEFRETITIIEG